MLSLFSAIASMACKLQPLQLMVRLSVCRIKLYYLLKPQKNTRRQNCIMITYYFLAAFSTLTQIANPIIILLVSEDEYKRLAESELVFGPIFIMRNSLTTAASFIYTCYNLIFTYKLQKLMQKNAKMRGHVRRRVLIQAWMI